MRGATRAIVLVVLALWLVPLPAEARLERVDIGPGFQFVPQEKFIRVGDMVRWTHKDDGTSHSVKSDPSSADEFHSSDNCPGGLINDCMTDGDTFEHRFDSVGKFEYFCEVHPVQMRGTINVVSSTPTIPPTTVSPTPTMTKTATTSPSPTGSASPSPSRSPSPSASPSRSASASPSPTSSPQASGPSSSGGAGGRAAIAVVAVIALAGAGYLVWRRFITT
jgi:plastocyanin